MIEYLVLFLAIPLGIICAHFTKDEKSIYNKERYFPFLMKVFLILTAVFISQDKQIFLTSFFLLIMIFVWNKV